MSRYYVQQTLEQWTSPSGWNRQTGSVVGEPEFITESDRQIWQQAGSPLIESGYSSGGIPLYYDVANLPTDPSQMSAYFASQADLVHAADGPLNMLWDFSTAATFLESGASGPQRAAFLDYMATARCVGPVEALPTDPVQVEAGQEIAQLQLGQASLYTDFLYAGIADSSSSIPSGAPVLPAWPFGRGRQPLPGSAY